VYVDVRVLFTGACVAAHTAREAALLQESKEIYQPEKEAYMCTYICRERLCVYVDVHFSG